MCGLYVTGPGVDHGDLPPERHIPESSVIICISKTPNPMNFTYLFFLTSSEIDWELCLFMVTSVCQVFKMAACRELFPMAAWDLWNSLCRTPPATLNTQSVATIASPCFRRPFWEAKRKLQTGPAVFCLEVGWWVSRWNTHETEALQKLTPSLPVLWKGCFSWLVISKAVLEPCASVLQP